MQQPQPSSPLSVPMNGPRPAFARPLPPNASSFSSSPPSNSSSPSSSASASPSTGSPLAARPLPSLVRRQQSFSSSSSTPTPGASAPAPTASSPLAASPTPTATATATGLPRLHVSSGGTPIPSRPAAPLPRTPSSEAALPDESLSSSLSSSSSSSSSSQGGSAIAGRSPRRPPNMLSPRGPLPPTPPGGSVPSPSSADLTSSASSGASTAASSTSPRTESAGAAVAEPAKPAAVAVGEGDWPTTGSQRHTPSVGPSLIAPFVPPTAAAGAAAAAAASQGEQSGPAAVTVAVASPGAGASPATRDEELLKVLTRDEGKIMTALLSALEFGDMDKITRAAVEYFVAAETCNDPNHPLLLRLLNGLIASEIAETEDPTTLFRSNTNGSKMLSACLRICGTPYLKNAIGPTIARVCRDTPAVEIDPERASSPEEAAANVANLYALCEAFLSTILTSVDSCPKFIRSIFAHLQEAAALRFHDNKQITVNYSIVGGFIFLRFFCSAIFSPFGFGVAAEQPKPEAMRAFVLVSKVLQMIANGLSFSDKTSEAYMRDMNPFLEAHQSDVIAFFRTIATVPEGDQSADAAAAADCQVVAPAAAFAAADALHAGLHKYAAALTAALGEINAQESSEALAAFLAAFPPPARAPSASKSASSSPSVSPVINERTGPGGDSVPSPIKKKGGLGFSAAGKRATTIMSTLRGGHDKLKEKEERREREQKEKEREQHSKEEDSSAAPQQTPTLLSARRKEEGGTLHDLKALLVQLREIKQTVEQEISGVEQQILDIISGQTPAESVTLSASTLALLAASKPQPPPVDTADAERKAKELRKAEKERERREKEEREREKREKREKEKEEKKEERRSRRLSTDFQSASKLKRRTVNLNSEEFSKDFAKFTETFGGAMKFAGRSSGSRSSGSGSRTGSRSGSGSGADIARPNLLVMADAAAADPLDSLNAGAAESASALKSVSAPALEQQHPGLHPPSEQDAVSFYSASGPTLEKRGSPLGHRASLALSSFTVAEKRHGLLTGDMSGKPGADQELTLKELAERAALPSSGLVKDRKQKLRTQKNCFVGSELVDWLVINRRAKTRAEAVNLAQQMYQQKLIVPVQSSDTQFEDKKGLYRFFGGSEGNLSPTASPTIAPPEPFPEDEPDEEIDQLYPYMVAEVEVKSRKDFENKTHKNCFVATQAVDWLMKNRHRPLPNDQALELAERLRQRGYIRWVGRKTKKISVSGPIMSVPAVASAVAVGPPFEDDDSYFVFERKDKNRAASSKRSK